MSIDEKIAQELDSIKEKRAENRAKDKKQKYTSFAMRCLYKKTVTVNNREMKLISHIVRTDKIYAEIFLILYNSEFILNRSYMSKYISKLCDCSLKTAYDKINELEELGVVEIVDLSVRLSKIALKAIADIDIKTVNYRVDSKTRSKMRINMYSKGYKKNVQERIERKLDINLTKEKIFILNENEILLQHKEKYSAKRIGELEKIISKINECMNEERFKRKGLNLYNYKENGESWEDIKRIYVISKQAEKHKINLIETEMLEDVIDYTEHKK